MKEYFFNVSFAYLNDVAVEFDADFVEVFNQRPDSTYVIPPEPVTEEESDSDAWIEEEGPASTGEIEGTDQQFDHLSEIDN